MTPPPVIEYAGAPARARRRRETAQAASFARDLDWVLLAAVAAAVAYGLWAIAGITKHAIPNDPDHFLTRQAVAAALGAVALVAALLVDPEVYRRYRHVIYGGTLVAMVFILVAGAAVRGSRRWIDLGFLQFQPSEFGKLFVALALAAFLADRGKRITESRTVLLALALAAPPILLVFLQPDIGTALVYAAALGAALFIGGARWWQLAALAATAAAVAVAVLWLLPASGIDVLKPYQTARLTAFYKPGHDPLGVTYNADQSITAIGAGGLRGRGVDAATQTSLNYVPEHETDFAFASLAEQRGFLGASVLLLLYLLIVWRGLKVITVAPSAFTAIAAGAIVVMLLFQIFVNVGMTMGIAPITGIPLPFVSVGGSSMIANLLAMGVLLAIGARSGSRPRR